MAMTEMNYGESGGITLTRHVENSASIVNGIITLSGVSGTVVCAVISFFVSSTKLVNVCDNVNDDILYNTDGGNFTTISKNKITQSGSTVTITTTTSGSSSAKVVYYTI